MLLSNPFNLRSNLVIRVRLLFNLDEPSEADPDLLPIYSGFIYATNQVNGEVAHMFCKFLFL